jgi:hypothetical protein
MDKGNPHLILFNNPTRITSKAKLFFVTLSKPAIGTLKHYFSLNQEEQAAIRSFANRDETPPQTMLKQAH